MVCTKRCAATISWCDTQNHTCTLPLCSTVYDETDLPFFFFSFGGGAETSFACFKSVPVGCIYEAGAIGYSYLAHPITTPQLPYSRFHMFIHKRRSRSDTPQNFPSERKLILQISWLHCFTEWWNAWATKWNINQRVNTPTLAFGSQSVEEDGSYSYLQGAK